MAHDLGDVVPLAVEIRNAAGALANAGAVVLTITLPDGTSAAGSVSNPSAGRYEADFPTTQFGRHVARWVATGANASAYVEVFDVRSASPAYMFSLADAKAHLQITATADDEELRFFVEAATEVVESMVGACVQRTVTEEIADGHYSLVLSKAPVIAIASVTSVWADGPSWLTADLRLDKEAGLVQRSTRGAYFTDGPWTAVYTPGRAHIPAKFIQAGKELLRHLWETQRGGEETEPNLEGFDEPYIPRSGFSVPRRVLELLEKDLLPRRVG